MVYWGEYWYCNSGDNMGAGAIAIMTPEETGELRDCLISAIKELGEIAECIVKDDGRPDHWKNELGDLCGLGIFPMLYLASLSFEEACDIGIRRKNEKLRAQSRAERC